MVALGYTGRAAWKQRQREKREHIRDLLIRPEIFRDPEGKAHDIVQLQVYNQTNYPVFELWAGYRARGESNYFEMWKVHPDTAIMPGKSAAPYGRSVVIGIDNVEARAWARDAWGNWWTRDLLKVDAWHRWRKRSDLTETINATALPRLWQSMRRSADHGRALARLSDEHDERSAGQKEPDSSEDPPTPLPGKDR